MIYLSILLSMNIGIISSLELLQIAVPQKFLYSSFDEHMFTISGSEVCLVDTASKFSNVVVPI